MQTIKVEDFSEMTMKGVHVFSFCDVRSELAQKYEQTLLDIGLRRQKMIELGLATTEKLKTFWDEYQYIKAIMHKKFLVRESVVYNKTTTVGRSLFMALVGGDTTNSGVVTHCALGTDATSPSIGDTILKAETFRKAISLGTNTNNIAILETVFSGSDVDGTFEEYMFFMNATGAADSGVGLNRFTETNVKSNVESLNIQSTITLNDA